MTHANLLIAEGMVVFQTEGNIRPGNGKLGQ
jgi:hypothetical protein